MIPSRNKTSIPALSFVPNGGFMITQSAIFSILPGSLANLHTSSFITCQIISSLSNKSSRLVKLISIASGSISIPITAPAPHLKLVLLFITIVEVPINRTLLCRTCQSFRRIEVLLKSYFAWLYSKYSFITINKGFRVYSDEIAF